MSLSKFESLPNEILIDTLEKYINGVDILVSLADQLSSRFDALIAQCQQLHFDFIRCQKDEFRHCIGLLPAYLDKIAGLALSERDTPGQIHAFLSFFPSFVPFKRLRTLHFHCNGEAVDPNQVQKALLSLSNTTVETLSINLTNKRKLPSLDRVLSAILRLTTVKRLFLAFSSDYSCCELPTSAPSNVEHLTLTGLHCEWKDLQSIFQYMTRLKYLNVQVTGPSSYRYNRFRPVVATEVDFRPMPTLRTLILHFDADDPTTFDMVAKCLDTMPILRRLEMTAHRELVNASRWEMLLQASLPQLTHFCLKTNVHYLEIGELSNVLASFRTSFWIAKKNFIIMITEHKPCRIDNVITNHVYGRRQRQFDQNHSLIFYPPVLQWWIEPRLTNGNIRVINSITSLRLSGLYSLPSRQYYFNNVKFLAVDNLNRGLLEWVTTYVNCLQITELAVSSSEKEPDAVTSLMASAKNMTSLQINFKELIAHHAAPIRRNSRLKCLDVSVEEHTFSKEEIITVAGLFPYIEHLAINTESLFNVPALHTHFPHLRSLTFKIVDPNFSPYSDYEQRMWDNQLRCKTQFLFQREANWITIWIDQAAFEELFWQTFANKSVKSIIAPVTSETSKKKKKSFKFKLPFLRWLQAQK